MKQQPVREYTLQEWLDAGRDLPLLEPFVVRGGCSTWPAYGKLNFDSLRAIAGGDNVHLLRFLTGEDMQDMCLAQFLTYCETTRDENPLYLQNWRYTDKHPDLRSWFDPPAMARNWLDLAPDLIPWSWIFVGPKHSGTPWHVDMSKTSFWNGAFVGTKDWEFIAAGHAYSESLLLVKPYNVPEPPDETVDRWFCRQEPGDLIFSPGGWGHRVLNLTAAVAVSENYVNERNYAVVSHYMESTNDPFAPRLKRMRAVALLGTPGDHFAKS